MARNGDGGTGETRLDVFTRGVLSGALAGAGIAGSTLWGRRRRRVAALTPGGPAPEGGPAGEGSAPSSPEGSAPEGAAPEA